MKENGGQKVHYLQKPVKLSLTTGERERERERERSSGMEIIYILNCPSEFWSIKKKGNYFFDQ